MFRKLRDDLFEQIKLRSKRVEKNESRTHASFYEAEFVAVHFYIGDLYLRCTMKARGRLGHGPNALEGEGCEPQSESNTSEYEKSPQNQIHRRTPLGIDHDIARDLCLAGKYVAFRLVFAA